LQQPPALHSLKSQHVSPGPPHAVHVRVFGSHATPEAVQ
jgi:hypothetical protein